MTRTLSCCGFQIQAQRCQIVFIKVCCTVSVIKEQTLVVRERMVFGYLGMRSGPPCLKAFVTTSCGSYLPLYASDVY